MRGGRERCELRRDERRVGPRGRVIGRRGCRGERRIGLGWQPRWSRVATGRVATASPPPERAKSPRSAPALQPLYTPPRRHAPLVPHFLPSPSFPRPGLQLCFPFDGCPLFPCPLRPCQATVHFLPAGPPVMQLPISFSLLLASILVSLTLFGDAATAAPAKRGAKMITLPLKRAHQKRTDVHPQVVRPSCRLYARIYSPNDHPVLAAAP